MTDQSLRTSDIELAKSILISTAQDSERDETARLEELLKSWTASSECAVMRQFVANPSRNPLPDVSALRAERSGWFCALRCLSARRWHDLLRDPMKLRIEFIQYLAFSVILGLVFLRLGKDQVDIQSRQGAIFFILMQIFFMSFLTNLNTFGGERLVVAREIGSGLYGFFPFFFSRWGVELPFRICFPIMYSVIAYWMIGLQSGGGRFLLFVICLVLTDICGSAMSVLICALFPTVDEALQAGTALLMPIMMFAGVYIQMPSIGWWFRWMSYISPLRYAFIAAIKNELQGMIFNCPLDRSCPTRTGEDALRLLGVDDAGSIGMNLLWLFLLIIGFLMIGLFFMKRTMKFKDVGH